MRNNTIHSYVPNTDFSKEIDKKIEETINGNGSNIEIAKLKQAKLLSAMFNNEFKIMRGRYNTPW